ncbi:MAG: RNA 2',3'-cyclic phosphodiesterase [Bacteroidota bacterium]
MTAHTSKIRCFIALPTSEEVRKQIAAVQRRLVETQAEVKWDAPEKFHITLKFLGNVETSVADLLGEALEHRVSSIPPFDIEYANTGAFPNELHPNVLWIGAHADENILRVNTLVEDVCSEFGFTKEQRSFHPHITLGRVKGGRNLRRLTEELKSITFEPIRSRCSHILLVKSDLKPTGSVYTTLKSIPFKP